MCITGLHTRLSVNTHHAHSPSIRATAIVDASRRAASRAIAATSRESRRRPGATWGLVGRRAAHPDEDSGTGGGAKRGQVCRSEGSLVRSSLTAGDVRSPPNDGLMHSCDHLARGLESALHGGCRCRRLGSAQGGLAAGKPGRLSATYLKPRLSRLEPS